MACTGNFSRLPAVASATQMYSDAAAATAEAAALVDAINVANAANASANTATADTAANDQNEFVPTVPTTFSPQAADEQPDQVQAPPQSTAVYCSSCGVAGHQRPSSRKCVNYIGPPTQPSRPPKVFKTPVKSATELSRTASCMLSVADTNERVVHVLRRMSGMSDENREHAISVCIDELIKVKTTLDTEAKALGGVFSVYAHKRKIASERQNNLQTPSRLSDLLSKQNQSRGGLSTPSASSSRAQTPGTTPQVVRNRYGTRSVGLPTPAVSAETTPNPQRTRSVPSRSQVVANTLVTLSATSAAPLQRSRSASNTQESSSATLATPTQRSQIAPKEYETRSQALQAVLAAKELRKSRKRKSRPIQAVRPNSRMTRSQDGRALNVSKNPESSNVPLKKKKNKAVPISMPVWENHPNWKQRTPPPPTPANDTQYTGVELGELLKDCDNCMAFYDYCYPKWLPCTRTTMYRIAKQAKQGKPITFGQRGRPRLDGTRPIQSDPRKPKKIKPAPLPVPVWKNHPNWKQRTPPPPAPANGAQYTGVEFGALLKDCENCTAFYNYCDPKWLPCTRTAMYRIAQQAKQGKPVTFGGGKGRPSLLTVAQVDEFVAETFEQTGSYNISREQVKERVAAALRAEADLKGESTEGIKVADASIANYLALIRTHPLVIDNMADTREEVKIVYASEFCTHPSGCSSRRGTKGLCRAHGGQWRCKLATGCEKIAISGGLCRSHGGGKKCAVDGGCVKSARGNGFCTLHGGAAVCARVEVDESVGMYESSEDGDSDCSEVDL